MDSRLMERAYSIGHYKGYTVERLVDCCDWRVTCPDGSIHFAPGKTFSAADMIRWIDYLADGGSIEMIKEFSPKGWNA